MKRFIASISVVLATIGLVACGGDKKSACEQTTGPCGPREELLVLQTQVKDGVVMTPSGMKEQAISAASVIVATEKARLAEEAFNRRAAELQAQTARLAAIEAAKTATPPDPCANLRGRTREVCEGL